MYVSQLAGCWKRGMRVTTDLRGVGPAGDHTRATQRQLGTLVGEGGGEEVAGAHVHARTRHQRRRRTAAQCRVQLAAARQDQVDLHAQPVE
jgi:hypothetical protein